MVTLSDAGVSNDRDTTTVQTKDHYLIKSTHQLNPSQPSTAGNSNNNPPLVAPRHLMDVPEGEVVQLDDPPRTPLSPTTTVDHPHHHQEVPFPINHPDHGIEIVDSPDSIKDTFPSPGLAPPYPTASSSTALYQNHPFGNPSVVRPSTSRRTSNASSVHPSVYHSPRIAPRSPSGTGSPAGSRPPSRAPSLGSHHALNAGLSGRTRSLSNQSQSGSSTSGPRGANVSRRSSAAGGGWRQSFSGGLRARPPSTLIPAPGHESETIPPSSDGSDSFQQDTIKGSLLPAASLRGPSPSPRPRSPHAVIIKDFAYTAHDDRFIGVYPSSGGSQPASRASSEAGDLFFSSGLPSGLGRSGSKGGSGNRRKSSFGGWGGFFGGWRRGSAQGSGLGLGNLTKVDTDVDLSSDLTPSSSFTEEGKSPLIGIARDENGERHHHDVWEDEDVSGDGELEGEEDIGPEPVGRYRVAYAFEGLGGHEMNVEEGDMLDVKGRGGGVGWVIAVRLRAAHSSEELMEGLVPESYLEVADS